MIRGNLIWKAVILGLATTAIVKVPANALVALAGPNMQQTFWLRRHRRFYS
jgi:hypothetical protein